MSKTFHLIWLTSAIIELVVVQPVQAQVVQEVLNSQVRVSDTKIPRLSNSDRPATTISEWLSPPLTAEKAKRQERILAQSPVQVTGVQLNLTEDGLEILLEALEKQQLQALTRSEGNTLITEIPNAVLALPEKEFRADDPAPGITSVTVTQLNAGRIRVIVTGETTVPTAEVVQSDRGLVLSLTPSEEQEIEIVVTATRTEEEVQDVPRSVTVISREEIEEQTAFSRDIQDILSRTVPGYGPPSGRAFSDSTSLRGRAPLVLIDGVPQTTNGSSSFGRELRTIDPASIERIEVVRGPSAIYGQGATGGVINIITRQPDEERLTSTVEVGVDAALGGLEAESFGNYLEYGLSINEGNVDLLVSLARDDTGASFDAEGDRIPIVQGTDESETFNLLGKLGWDISDQQRLQLSVNYYDTERDTSAISDPIIEQIPGLQKPRALVFAEGINFIDASPQSDQNTVVNLDYTHENILGSKVQAQAYYRNNKVQSDPRDRRSRNQGIFQAVLDLENWGGRLQIETPLFNNVSLLWGADYVNEEATSSRNLFASEEFDSSEGRVYRKIDQITLVPPYELNSLGLFAQLEWDVTERLAFSGGLRHEQIDVSVDNFTNSSGEEIAGGEIDANDTVFNVGALYRLTAEVSLFANFAQGFSIPSVVDVLFDPAVGFSFARAIPDFRLQKVNNYEIGVRGNWNAVQVSLAGFYNESDLGSAFVDIDGDSFFELFRAPERIYGVEATIDWQPGGGWQLGGTVSWVEGESDFPDDDQGFLALSGFDIQPLKISAYIQHQTTPSWRNRLQALYVGNRDRAFEDSVDLAPVSSYLVVDYISSIQLGSGTLQIGIQNLFDNQYFPAYSQILRVEEVGFESFASQASGRTISVGYRITW